MEDTCTEEQYLILQFQRIDRLDGYPQPMHDRREHIKCQQCHERLVADSVVSEDIPTGVLKYILPSFTPDIKVIEHILYQRLRRDIAWRRKAMNMFRNSLKQVWYSAANGPQFCADGRAICKIFTVA